MCIRDSLRVVQSESALISNTIFSPSPYFHFLMEHGSKNCCFVIIREIVKRLSVKFNLNTELVITGQNRTISMSVKISKYSFPLSLFAREVMFGESEREMKGGLTSLKRVTR